MMHIGTQTFGIAKELTTDFSGTLHTLHDIGFNTLEPLVLFSGKQGNPPKNLWAQDTLAGCMIIDQDKYAGDMLEALKTGFENVRVMAGENK